MSKIGLVLGVLVENLEMVAARMVIGPGPRGLSKLLAPWSEDWC